MRTVLIRVSGKVQGVFYRASARDAAQALGLSGWVRNCADGSVEALASGPDEKLDEFIRWCHRGPEQAVVQQVDVTENKEKIDSPGFHIRR